MMRAAARCSQQTTHSRWLQVQNHPLEVALLGVQLDKNVFVSTVTQKKCLGVLRHFLSEIMKQVHDASKPVLTTAIGNLETALNKNRWIKQLVGSVGSSNVPKYLHLHTDFFLCVSCPASPLHTSCAVRSYLGMKLRIRRFLNITVWREILTQMWTQPCTQPQPLLLLLQHTVYDRVQVVTNSLSQRKRLFFQHPSSGWREKALGHMQLCFGL